MLRLVTFIDGYSLLAYHMLHCWPLLLWNLLEMPKVRLLEVNISIKRFPPFCRISSTSSAPLWIPLLRILWKNGFTSWIEVWAVLIRLDPCPRLNRYMLIPCEFAIHKIIFFNSITGYHDMSCHEDRHAWYRITWHQGVDSFTMFWRIVWSFACITFLNASICFSASTSIVTWRTWLNSLKLGSLNLPQGSLKSFRFLVMFTSSNDNGLILAMSEVYTISNLSLSHGRMSRICRVKRSGWLDNLNSWLLYKNQCLHAT